jgi:hypothetical protein
MAARILGGAGEGDDAVVVSDLQIFNARIILLDVLANLPLCLRLLVAELAPDVLCEVKQTHGVPPENVACASYRYPIPKVG